MDKITRALVNPIFFEIVPKIRTDTSDYVKGYTFSIIRSALEKKLLLFSRVNYDIGKKNIVEY